MRSDCILMKQIVFIFLLYCTSGIRNLARAKTTKRKLFSYMQKALLERAQ